MKTEMRWFAFRDIAQKNLIYVVSDADLGLSFHVNTTTTIIHKNTLSFLR